MSGSDEIIDNDHESTDGPKNVIHDDDDEPDFEAGRKDHEEDDDASKSIDPDKNKEPPAIAPTENAKQRTQTRVERELAKLNTSYNPTTTLDQDDDDDREAQINCSSPLRLQRRFGE